MSGAYSQIVKDIGTKCGDDVSATVRRNMLLMDNRKEAAQVAMVGAAGALGMAAGAMAAAVCKADPTDAELEATADHLWQILRPMVLLGLRQREGFRHG